VSSVPSVREEEQVRDKGWNYPAEKSKREKVLKLAGSFKAITLAAFVAANAMAFNSSIAAPPAPTSVVRLFMEFETVFQPGVWNGFALGSASNTTGYIVEVTPLTNPAAGYFTHAVQQEFDDIGSTGWRDVARIQFNGTGSVTANVRVYSVGPK
jgi:hypothetical protein